MYPTGEYQRGGTDRKPRGDKTFPGSSVPPKGLKNRSFHMKTKNIFTISVNDFFFFPENQSPQINVISETQGCGMDPRLLGGCSSLLPSTVLGTSWVNLRRVELSYEYVSGFISNLHLR